MKNRVLLIIFAVFFAGLLSAAEAFGQDKSCQFEAAGPDDVYLIIREKVDPGDTREIVMWEGWIKRDQIKPYTSQTGQLSYDYRLSSNGLTIGDNSSACEDGQTIEIP
jgi:hypothetical protein